ncbi:hypothetical protein M1D95_17140 [Bacillus sp. PK3-130]
MKTSFIVLTYNQLALTKQCLESRWTHTDDDCIEGIVVDNRLSIKTIFNETNEGFAKACNQGLEG